MFEKRRSMSGSGTETAAAPSTAGAETPGMSLMPGKSGQGASAVIGPTIRINGDLAGDEDIIVAGEFEGSVNLPNHTLTIRETGKVSGDIRANAVDVHGEVLGDVAGNEWVGISKTGRMEGNIISPRVVLSDGAKFKGSIDMDPSQIADIGRPKAAQEKTPAASPAAAASGAPASAAAGSVSASGSAIGSSAPRPSPLSSAKSDKP